MKINHLFEAPSSDKHVTFCFGRMNPPTIGHKQLLDTMSSVGGDMKIFVSQSQDAKKNPLDYSTKISFMRKLFPDYASDIVEEPSLNTVMKVAAYLYNQGYNHATFVAGSDRLEDMKKMLLAYNGKEEGKKGPLPKETVYKFETLDFVSSGDREDGAEGVAGVSASAARAAAANGDLDAFAKATGAGEHIESLYKAVRTGMGLSAETKGVEERFQNKLNALLEQQNIDWDSIYQGINSAEWRGVDPGKTGTGHYTRTRGPDPNDKTFKGSTAYGPVQLTGKTASDIMSRYPDLYKDFDPKYAQQFIDQSKSFAKHGRNKGKIPDYDPKYDYGGAGDLSDPSTHALYKDFAIRAMKGKYKDLQAKGITNPTPDDIAKAWRGVDPSKDPEYFKAFTAGRLPKPTGPSVVGNPTTGNTKVTNSFTNEAPIEMDLADPMNPTIVGTKSNPAKLKYRMARAANQLKDLAARAETASPSEWQRISRNFDELAMNIGEIKHALSELGKMRKKGGIKSRGIDPNIEAEAMSVLEAEIDKTIDRLRWVDVDAVEPLKRMSNDQLKKYAKDFISKNPQAIQQFMKGADSMGGFLRPMIQQMAPKYIPATKDVNDDEWQNIWKAYDNIDPKVKDKIKAGDLSDFETNSVNNESNLVVPVSSVRGAVIDLIKDKIIQTNDYEELSKWLKMIVGKSIKPRGKSRYIITSEDVVEAIGRVREHIGK